jgi:hypothetical protein
VIPKVCSISLYSKCNFEGYLGTFSLADMKPDLSKSDSFFSAPQHRTVNSVKIDGECMYVVPPPPTLTLN